MWVASLPRRLIPFLFYPERYSVVVYRVDSEDPWRVRPILRHDGLGWGDAGDLHSKLVEGHEGMGYSCYEQGDASHGLRVGVCHGPGGAPAGWTGSSSPWSPTSPTMKRPGRWCKRRGRGW